MSKKNFPKYFLQLSFISILTFCIWYKTLNQGLWGDGFYWFNPLLRGYHIFPITFSHPVYNALSRVIFDLIIQAFRDNMIYYQLLQIILLIVLAIVIYVTTLKLTNKMIIAFSTCIIFVSNYGGIYEMIGEGNLNRFLERVPNLIIVMVSIYFLIKFLETKKRKHLMFSWFIFVVGIYLGHFSSFVLPFFILYPIIYLFDTKKPVKSFLTGTIIAIIFTVSNFMIIRNSDQRSGYGLAFYLNPEQRFIEKTFLMTTPLIIPREIVINLAKHISIRNPYVPIVQLYTIALGLISVIVGFLLNKKNNKIFRLYAACILTMLAGTALMIYTDPVKYDPFKNFGAGRHVFIQSIFYSILISSVITTFLEKRRIFPAIFLFLIIFVIYNTNLSWRDISSTQYIYQSDNLYIDYIKKIGPKFKPGDTVVVGPTLMHASAYINDFLVPNYVSFVSAPEDIQKILKNDKNTIYVIDVDYNPTNDGYYLPERVKIIDLSKFYREGKLDLTHWGEKPVRYYESLYNIK